MWLLAEMERSHILFLAGMALACAILMMRSQRKIRQSNSKAPSAPPALDPRKQAAEFNRWEVQMHETARELIARIDTKLALLESLIRDADDRIVRLEEVNEWLNRSGTGADPSGIVLTKLSREAPPPSVPPDAATHSERLPTSSAGTSTVSRPYDEIYALADAGHSSAAIAGRIGAPVGEVELILGLRAQR